MTTRLRPNVPRFGNVAAEGARRNAIADAVEIVRAGLAHLVPRNEQAEWEADKRLPTPWPRRGGYGHITAEEAFGGIKRYEVEGAPDLVAVCDIGEDGDIIILGWHPDAVVLDALQQHGRYMGYGDEWDTAGIKPERIGATFAEHHDDCTAAGWEPDDWDVEEAHEDQVELEPERCGCDEYGWWVNYVRPWAPNTTHVTLVQP